MAEVSKLDNSFFAGPANADLPAKAGFITATVLRTAKEYQSYIDPVPITNVDYNAYIPLTQR